MHPGAPELAGVEDHLPTHFEGDVLPLEVAVVPLELEYSLWPGSETHAVAHARRLTGGINERAKARLDRKFESCVRSTGGLR